MGVSFRAGTGPDLLQDRLDRGALRFREGGKPGLRLADRPLPVQVTGDHPSRLDVRDDPIEIALGRAMEGELPGGRGQRFGLDVRLAMPRQAQSHGGARR